MSTVEVREMVRRSSWVTVIVFALVATIVFPTAHTFAAADTAGALEISGDGTVMALTANRALEATANTVVAMPARSGNYHIVRKGETLSQIARYFGVSVAALAQANGISNPSYIYVGQHLYIPASGGVGSVGCAGRYIVRPGDKLSVLAAYFGVSTAALASINGIANPSYIYVGQKLCVPSAYGPAYPSHGHDMGHGGGYYVVKAGDTLSEIAAWHGTSVHYLMRINGLHNPNYIYVGQHLRLS